MPKGRHTPERVARPRGSKSLQKAASCTGKPVIGSTCEVIICAKAL